MALVVTNRQALTLPPRERYQAEEWRSVVGFEGLYLVSSLGRVMRIGRAKGATVPRILKPRRAGHCYHSVYLSRHAQGENHYVHHLVLEAFVGPCPPDHEADHRDFDPENNSLCNLRWFPVIQNRRRKNVGTNCDQSAGAYTATA